MKMILKIEGLHIFFTFFFLEYISSRLLYHNLQNILSTLIIDNYYFKCHIKLSKLNLEVKPESRKC